MCAPPGVSLRTGAIVLAVFSIIGGLSWFFWAAVDVWYIGKDNSKFSFSLYFSFSISLSLSPYLLVSLSPYLHLHPLPFISFPCATAWLNLQPFSNSDVAFCVLAGLFNIAVGDNFVIFWSGNGNVLFSGIIGIIGAVKSIPWAVRTHFFSYSVCIGWNICTILWTSFRGFNQGDRDYEAAITVFIFLCLVC